MQCSSLPDAISTIDYVTNRVFCCVGALAITGSLHHIDKDLLGWWLCERQVKSGGLNGRPEKLPDVGKAHETRALRLEKKPSPQPLSCASRIAPRLDLFEAQGCASLRLALRRPPKPAF
ncbi:hypothetical protein HYC85_023444 [Camellia sinensis]|uniref:Geranylgeranyl transferase type II subunit beta n=1 Tax=Camellia sinensis TaxID=4442 RepID=A0A7J7GFU3_CAMSI|nr:hypothetical protein HYC85_023444 [Camellia sinensis]